MREKRKYEKPSQRIIELQQRAQLLQASGGPYPGWDNEDI